MIGTLKDAESDFVAFLSVKNSDCLNKNLIEPRVERFFSEQKIKKYKSIVGDSGISDLDLERKNVKFSYFYDFIFNDISKKKDEVELPVKYCITLDKENCPQTCEVTNILYDVMYLYKTPVFYFIYIDIKDIFEFLRKDA